MQISWSIEPIHLELKYTWKISRNSSDEKTNFIVKVGDEKVSGYGEVAPNKRYEETPEKIVSEFEQFSKLIPKEVVSLEEFNSDLDKFNISKSLRFGIESAYCHYLCKSQNTTVYNLLNITAPKEVYTAYTLPIMDPALIKEFMENNRLSRFKFLKIKVNQEIGLDTIKEVSKYVEGPIMVDANEDWKDVEALIPFMEQLAKYKIQFVEQPLPSSLNEEYIHLKKYSKIELIADESFISHPDFDLLQKQFDGVNMKLMKAGGYLNGSRLLGEAQKRGFKTMIGCMVETSLGISSAMRLCHGINYIDLDGSLIIKNEPFGLLKENNGLLQFN